MGSSLRYEINSNSEKLDYCISYSKNITFIFYHSPPTDKIIYCALPLDENDPDATMDRFDKIYVLNN
jgi:hypothetical protein